MKITIRSKVLLCFFLLCSCIVVTGIFEYFHLRLLKQSGLSLAQNDFPLIDAVMELKYSIADGHIILEEVLSGDFHEDIDEAWEKFNSALWFCDAILEGGVKNNNVYKASTNKEVTSSIEKTRKYLESFIELSLKRYKIRSTRQTSGSNVDQLFDKKYQRLTALLLEISKKDPSLTHTADQLRFELADTHLSLEEGLSGDTEISFTLIHNRFETIKERVHALQLTYDDLDWSEITLLLAEFVAMAEERQRITKEYSGAGSTIDEEFDRIYDDLILMTNRAENAILRQVHESRLQMEAVAEKSRMVTIVATLFSLLAALSIGLMLAHHLAAPIVFITARLKEIARGALPRFSMTPRADEIGLMYQNLTAVIDSMRLAADQADKVAAGEYEIEITPRSEEDTLGLALVNMTAKLAEMKRMSLSQLWHAENLAELATVVRGVLNRNKLAHDLCLFYCHQLKACMGAFYTISRDGSYGLSGSYAPDRKHPFPHVIYPGEGLCGEAITGKRIVAINDIPHDYFQISSALGELLPSQLILLPFIYEGRAVAVLELALFHALTKSEMDFLNSSLETVAIAVNSVLIHEKLDQLLLEAQNRTEELQQQQEELQAANEEMMTSQQKLQVQQEELQVSNEELEQKTKSLQQSEQQLQAQQEELRASNEELEIINQDLETKRQLIEIKNADLENAKKHLEMKADELEQSSKYKSEFLANMSHELRTPLNSLLILAQDLSSNKKKNLTHDQVESAQVILKGGNDLLKLINEILDLSKIEAGRMSLVVEDVLFRDISENLLTHFKNIAANQHIRYEVSVDKSLPDSIRTDYLRMEQILRNLIANALKFTKEGAVTVTFSKLSSEEIPPQFGQEPCVGISVTDTGIGIPAEKHQVIFDAFQQVDGSTSREYGGTGLGLSISRELAHLLGGEIHLTSDLGVGSTFSLILPLSYREKQQQDTGIGKEQLLPVAPPVLSKKTVAVTRDRKPAPSIDDDRNHLDPETRSILIIEDDLAFATTLKKFCHERDFLFLHAGDGETGIELVKKYFPDGIILDLKLPGMTGWEVLQALKADPSTESIPVHIMSVEEAPTQVANLGAIGFLTKPATIESLTGAFESIELQFHSELQELLLVEDDPVLRENLQKLIQRKHVHITSASTGREALTLLRQKSFDCMILDLSLPDKSGIEILKDMAADEASSHPSIIVYTGRDLTHDEDVEIRRYADSIVLKTAFSPQRLLDETTLFLHKIRGGERKYKKPAMMPFADEAVLIGRKILVVDDDMRNLFAIAKILHDKEMIVYQASNGKKALDILKKEDDIDVVLMDIMMPVMDGYQAIQEIRKQPEYVALPIIALTAKAMPGDRGKCIEAGANDYLSKPVEINKLLSLIRVWLHR